MAFLSSFYPQPVVAGTTEGTYAAGNATRIIDVTHAELLSLMGAQNLKRGFHYRITDFVTEYMSNDNEWISPSNTANVSNNNGTAFTVASIAATPEPLIVYAHTSSNVAREAYSESFPQDIIHYDPQLTYLDGTRTAKGFIVYRRDPVRNLECFYDWRNVRFKRWSIDPAGGVNPIPQLQGNTSYTIGNLVYASDAQAIFYCVKNHTSASTPVTSGNFIDLGLYSGPFQILTSTKSFNGQLGCGQSNSLSNPNARIFDRGSYNVAYYFNTFSNFNGTLDSGLRYRNINISRVSTPTPSSTISYSSFFPNNVFINNQINARNHFNIKLNNSTGCTIYGSAGNMRDVNINNSRNIELFSLGALGYSNSNILNSVNLYCRANASNYNINNSENCILTALVNRFTMSGSFSNTVTNAAKEVKWCNNVLLRNSRVESYSDLLGNVNPLDAVEPQSSISLLSSLSGATMKSSTNRIPVISFVNEINENEVIAKYKKEDLLHYHINEEILNAIDGKNPATSKAIFSTLDHSTPTYVRNSSCWLNDYVEDLTCASPWNSAYTNLFGATAITPRHVLFARHVSTPLTGATIRFITSDNQIISRTILRVVTESGSTFGDADSGIALLGEDLPNSIHRAKILPISMWKNFPYGTAFSWAPASGIFYIDQEKNANIIDFGIYFGSVLSGGVINATRPLSPSGLPDLYKSNYDANKHEFYEPIVTNDSGGPVFAIINGELVLMGALTLGAASPPEEGQIVGSFWIKSNVYNTLIAQVDAAEGISTGYTVTPVDLSGFAELN